MAVTFAVGAVTGTVLSFEMGLLWPGLMGRYGGAFGIPFAIEGLFFFLEAIFIAIYIYGWRRLSPGLHLLSGVPVALAGIGGTFSVVAANSWMNQPPGFEVDAAGKVVAVDPDRGHLQPGDLVRGPAHVPGRLHGDGLPARVGLRGRAAARARGSVRAPRVRDPVRRRGDRRADPGHGRRRRRARRAGGSARQVRVHGARRDDGPHQPEIIGGVLVDGQVVGGLAIPSLASLIAGFSPDTVITGFDAIPIDERPPATIVHLAWDAMVGTGTALVVLATVGADPPPPAPRLRDVPLVPACVALAGFGAILALEAGWIVTEVGRQPWVVYGYLRTADAVTHASGVRVTFIGVVILYSALGIATLVALLALKRRWATQDASADGGRAFDGAGARR